MLSVGARQDEWERCRSWNQSDPAAVRSWGADIHEDVVWPVLPNFVSETRETLSSLLQQHRWRDAPRLSHSSWIWGTLRLSWDFKLFVKFPQTVSLLCCGSRLCPAGGSMSAGRSTSTGCAWSTKVFGLASSLCQLGTFRNKRAHRLPAEFLAVWSFDLVSFIICSCDICMHICILSSRHVIATLNISIPWLLHENFTLISGLVTTTKRYGPV